MSRTGAPSVARTFPHRWCPLFGRTVIAAGMVPALFAGATGVTLLALAAIAVLGLLMTAVALRSRHRSKAHARPVRAAVAFTTDVLVLLVAAGLLIGAQLGGSGAPAILTTGNGLAVVAGFLALCAVHHVAHRHPRRSRRRL
ncbi:hypothetical protein [Streptomyces sp. NBC_01601]|uniref:hypothetical protein n=1 Tax=Streptomyces sp. NBC_01601 TaxID=2975892 RepID=UPI002E2A8639|nr:hypothetical protein [Streptomyces sp. NBC_01601]